MSTAVFPILSGQSFPVIRTPMFKSQIITSVSGKEVRVNLQSAPRYQYELSFDLLRAGSAFYEWEKLQAFFLNRQGTFDSFLYSDPYDNSVTGQSLGVADGTTKTFQLVRAFGDPASPKWVDVIYAPVISGSFIGAVKDNGSPTTSYTVTGWGQNNPGVVTFNTAPLAGHTITADFAWYWPCRFTDDQLDFSLFMKNMVEVRSVKFISII